MLGRPGEVEAKVRAAERGSLPGPLGDGSSSIESSAALVRTSARLLLGDVGAAAQSAAVASELEPDKMAPWRAHVTNALGMTRFWSGAFEDAERAFAETVSAGKPLGLYAAVICARWVIWPLSPLSGPSWRRSTSAWPRPARWLSVEALGEHWVTVMVHYAAGQHACARGEIDVAWEETEHGLNIARRGGLRLDTVYGLFALARIAREAGTPADAAVLRAGRGGSWPLVPTPASCHLWSGRMTKWTGFPRPRPWTGPTSS